MASILTLAGMCLLVLCRHCGKRLQMCMCESHTPLYLLGVGAALSVGPDPLGQPQKHQQAFMRNGDCPDFDYLATPIPVHRDAD